MGSFDIRRAVEMPINVASRQMPNVASIYQGAQYTKPLAYFGQGLADVSEQYARVVERFENQKAEAAFNAMKIAYEKEESTQLETISRMNESELARFDPKDYVVGMEKTADGILKSDEFKNIDPKAKESFKNFAAGKNVSSSRQVGSWVVGAVGRVRDATQKLSIESSADSYVKNPTLDNFENVRKALDVYAARVYGAESEAARMYVSQYLDGVEEQRMISEINEAGDIESLNAVENEMLDRKRGVRDVAIEIKSAEDEDRVPELEEFNPIDVYTYGRLSADGVDFSGVEKDEETKGNEQESAQDSGGEGDGEADVSVGGGSKKKFRTSLPFKIQEKIREKRKKFKYEAEVQKREAENQLVEEHCGNQLACIKDASKCDAFIASYDSSSVLTNKQKLSFISDMEQIRSNAQKARLAEAKAVAKENESFLPDGVKDVRYDNLYFDIYEKINSVSLSAKNWVEIDNQLVELLGGKYKDELGEERVREPRITHANYVKLRNMMWEKQTDEYKMSVAEALKTLKVVRETYTDQHPGEYAGTKQISDMFFGETDAAVKYRKGVSEKWSVDTAKWWGSEKFTPEELEKLVRGGVQWLKDNPDKKHLFNDLYWKPILDYKLWPARVREADKKLQAVIGEIAVNANDGNGLAAQSGNILYDIFNQRYSPKEEPPIVDDKKRK